MDNAGWWVGVAGFITALTTAIVTVMKTRHSHKMEENSILVKHWRDYAERHEKALQDGNETIGKLVRMVMKQNSSLTVYSHCLERFHEWAVEAASALTNVGYKIRAVPALPEKMNDDFGAEAEFLARQVAQVGELLKSRPPDTAPPAGPGVVGPEDKP